jgi:NTE family protein
MKKRVSRRNFIRGVVVFTAATVLPLSTEAGASERKNESSRRKYHEKVRLKNRDFSLVLAGGGALGIAHLGVLYDLEKRHLLPGEIVGTSMGGIIGACLAIGMREPKIYEKIKSFTGITDWAAFSLMGNGLIESSKLSKIFDGIFGERKMKDTAIPLKLIATNLHNGHKKVFDRYDDVYIKDAVLATMSIPGVFEEKIIHGIAYGDGYLCENLGINEAVFHTLLAVDVMGENSFGGPLPEGFFKATNVIEMFERSVRILVYNQTRRNLSCSKKKIYLIEPDTKGYRTYDFGKYKPIRALGLNLL